MNRKYLSALLTLLSTTTFAQIKFAPEAGIHMGMQTVKTKPASASVTSSETSTLSPGFTGGVIADIKVLRNLYIQTGAFYTFDNIRYSSKVDLSQYDLGTPVAKRFDRLYSTRFPLFIMYKSGVEGMGRFIAGAGPYASYIFAGSRVQDMPYTTYDDKTQQVSYVMKHFNNDMKLGNDRSTDQLRQWDYGVNACIGYQANVGLYFRGYFNYGLPNLAPGNSSDYRIRNWGFGLSIGYLIGKDDW